MTALVSLVAATVLASLVPEKINVGSLVISSLPLVPVSWVMAAMTGAAGAVWSTTTRKVAEIPLTFPAKSLAVALKSCVPWVNVVPV